MAHYYCYVFVSFSLGIQASVQTRDAWTQYIAPDVTGRSSRTFCDLSEEEDVQMETEEARQEEEDLMDKEDARKEEEGSTCSEFMPDSHSSSESSDGQSTPERPTQRLKKYV